jgi:hypothetical protein
MLGILSPKNTLNLCYDILIVSCIAVLPPGEVAVAAIIFLVIKKTGSQVFFLTLTPLRGPYTVKK